MLGQGAIAQRGHVARAQADRTDAVGHAGGAHQRFQLFGEHFTGLVGRRAAHVGPEQLGRAQVSLGVGRRGEAHDRRRVDDHRHAVRHERFEVRIVGRVVFVSEARDRVGHRMRHLDAGVAEADAGQGRGVHHTFPGLAIRGIFHRAYRELAQNA